MKDTFILTLRDPITTDSENITMTETTETSKIFTGEMLLKKLGLPTNNDGTLLVQVGDSIIGEYIDEYDAADTSFDTATIEPVPGASSLSIDRTMYQASQNVVITVVDLDQNLNALSADTILVWVQSSQTLDEETVVLTETAPASRATRPARRTSAMSRPTSAI